MNLLLIPLFAFLYRCRGGFLGTGHTQLGRLIYWVIPVGIWAVFQNPLLAPACALTAFLGLLIPHSKYMASATFKSVAGMGLIGMARLSLILAPLAYYSPVVLIFAPLGLLSGLGYYIGWKYLHGIDSRIYSKGYSLLGISFTSGPFAIAGCEWGEVFTGAAFGLAFWLLNA